MGGNLVRIWSDRWLPTPTICLKVPWITQLWLVSLLIVDGVNGKLIDPSYVLVA